MNIITAIAITVVCLFLFIWMPVSLYLEDARYEQKKLSSIPYRDGKEWVDVDALLKNPKYYEENQDGHKTYYVQSMLQSLMTEYANSWVNLSYTPHTVPEQEENFWQGVHDAIIEAISYERESSTLKHDALKIAKVQQTTIDEIL